MRFETGDELQCRFSESAHQPGVLFEGAVDFQKAVVIRLPGVVQQHLTHAETFVYGIEQRAVAQLGFP